MLNWPIGGGMMSLSIFPLRKLWIPLFLKDEPIKEGQHVVSAIVAVLEYGDFECQTTINKPNQVMSGLVYYATHDRSVGLGVKSDRLIGWRLEEENFEELYNGPIRSEGPVYLRSSIKEAHQIKFYYSTDNKTWKVVPSKESIKADHLSLWSWGMKVGLFVKAGEGLKTGLEHLGNLVWNINNLFHKVVNVPKERGK